MLGDGKTYDKKGGREVWAESGQSNLDKRQATVQLTVFIFRGKGLEISAKEKQSYDRRVKVMYQEKVCFDQEIMKEYISTEWANPFKNPIG